MELAEFVPPDFREIVVILLRLARPNLDQNIDSIRRSLN
jgi:hypothetical protein